MQTLSGESAISPTVNTNALQQAIAAPPSYRILGDSQQIRRLLNCEQQIRGELRFRSTTLRSHVVSQFFRKLWYNLTQSMQCRNKSSKDLEIVSQLYKSFIVIQL